MSDSEKGLWEKQTAEQRRKNKYRFGGERYGFRGNCISQFDDYIPQTTGLYAFPKGDMQDENDQNGVS